MKKYKLPVLVLIFCFLFSSVPVYAANVIGKAVHTDIVYYINGLPIRSYNVKGQTAIVAEDLREYGFLVLYDNSKRQLEVICDLDIPNVKITANYVPPKKTKPIGSFLANVYATNIVTLVNGEKVPSYNIGGQTLIFIDTLKCYGDVIWKPEERKVYFNYVPDWRYGISKEEANMESTEELGFTLKLNRNAANTFDVSGTNIESLASMQLSGGRDPHITFGFALEYEGTSEQMNHTEMELFRPMLNVDRGEFIKDTVDFSNAHMKVKINGTPVAITEVQGGGGNNHTDYYFVFDKPMRNVEDIQSLEIECK